jgi:hypothetical protein
MYYPALGIARTSVVRKSPDSTLKIDPRLQTRNISVRGIKKHHPGPGGVFKTYLISYRPAWSERRLSASF